jgi:hypothetical protein
MRTSKGLFLTIGLALTVSAPAGAVVSIGLVQVGGTYSASVGIQPGDTLVLSITYSLQPGDAVTLIDPAIVWNPPMATFHPELSTETGFASWSGGAVSFSPVATGDLSEPIPGLAHSWEKSNLTPGGITSPCVFGACTSMGTAYFVLSGISGTFAIGAVGMPYGTVVGDGTFVDIAGISNLGTFTVIPEPTTAALLGLGLLGLTAIGRRRRR